MICTRSLELEDIPFHVYRPVMPRHALQWSIAELEAWRQDLERRGLFDDHVRAAWERRLQWRAEQFESAVVYRHNYRCAPEAMAEAPLDWRAMRAWFNDPVLPLISHDIASVFDECRRETQRPSAAAGSRLLEHARRWASARPGASLYSDGIALRGGLRLLIVGPELRLLRRGEVVLTAPACDDQLPRLRRIATMWRQLVRHAVAGALRHAVVVFSRRSVEDRLEFVLPVCGSGTYCEVFRVHENRVRQEPMEVLSPTSGEGPARRAVAASLTGSRLIDPDLDAAIERAVDQLDYGIFSSLDPALPTAEALMSAMDETARQFIRPVFEGMPVAWGEPADAFDVYQDGICGPELLGRVPNLATAMALERGNRKEVTMRLGLAVGERRLGYVANNRAA